MMMCVMCRLFMMPAFGTRFAITSCTRSTALIASLYSLHSFFAFFSRNLVGIWRRMVLIGNGVLVELGDQAGKAFTVEIEDLNMDKEILGFRLCPDIYL
jgi:hypothetical protein